jgi:ubiquinone/menaquinone biosynthesis C-methylase UbiE
MRRFLRKPASERDPLAVTMSGVRLGERALQIGGGDARSIALIAAKTGLTGTAAIVVRDNDDAVRIRRAVADTGALVDLRVVADARLPFDDTSFDVVVVHDTSTILDGERGGGTAPWLRECRRLLRNGGRIVTIERGTPVGLRSLFAARRSKEASQAHTGEGNATSRALTAADFATVRMLGDREGLRFTEAFKTH